jgi:tetratricopeptide (TPR) repeat protein
MVLRDQDDSKKLAEHFGAFQVRCTLEDLEKTLSANPDSVLALGGLAAVHIARLEPEKAARYLTREIELREDGFHKAKALLQLAVALHQLGKPDKAEQALNQATRMAPRLARAWYLLGDFLRIKGRFTEAIDYYERGLELDPNNVSILEKTGEIRLQRNEPSEARTIFERILETDADNFAAHFNLGALKLRQQHAEAAIRHFEAAIRSRPEVAQTYNQLGIAWGMRQEFERATTAFEQALEIDNSLADAHLNLATIHELSGRHQLAARHYRRRLELPDPPIAATVKLAWILATSPDEAVRDPDEAVRLAEIGAKATEPRLAIVLDRLAAAYAAAGRFEEAITTAEEALQLAQQRGQTGITQEIQSRLAKYRQQQPYRQPAAR